MHQTYIRLDADMLEIVRRKLLRYKCVGRIQRLLGYGAADVGYIQSTKDHGYSRKKKKKEKTKKIFHIQVRTVA